jgi:integrase
VRLLLLTAQRRGEVAGMRWSEVSFEERMWTIPASRTKSNRAQLLPLSPLALSVIASIPRVDDKIVFPARGNASTHPSGFSKVKRRLDELSGATGWTCAEVLFSTGSADAVGGHLTVSRPSRHLQVNGLTTCRRSVRAF